MNVFVKAFLMPKVKMSAKKHFKGSPRKRRLQSISLVKS